MSRGWEGGGAGGRSPLPPAASGARPAPANAALFVSLLLLAAAGTDTPWRDEAGRPACGAVTVRGGGTPGKEPGAPGGRPGAPTIGPVPTHTPGSQGADPFEQAHVAARELARQTGEAEHHTVVVLGTALAPVAPMLGATGSPVDLAALPWFPRTSAPGHTGEAWSVRIGELRVLVVAGRLHLYEGHDAHQVVHLTRTAIAAGCRTVVLTNASGGVRADLPTGRVVLIGDHLNLTATSPLTGFPATHPAGSPFVSLVDAWSPRLRRLAAEVEPGLAEGVYAQLPGPHFETPAEIRMLAAIGADLVGMSTVLEAIAARHLGAEVLGLSVVTNAAAGQGYEETSLDSITVAATAAHEQVARLTAGVLAAAGRPPA